MSISTLTPGELRLSIAPDTLGYADTSELLDHPLPWIGQARAETAARFGLGMDQPDYHLFVLGEVGSGRSSLLEQAMREVAATRPTPPDLCYLYNHDAPQRPRALYLPAGRGKLLKQQMAQMVRSLQTEIQKSAGALSRNAFQSLLDTALQQIDRKLAVETMLSAYLNRIAQALLDNLALLSPHESTDDSRRKAAEEIWSHCRIELVVDNADLQGAPVIIADNPHYHILFGHIEAAADDAATSHAQRIQAGDLHRAHGGFLMLHLRDLAEDPPVRERLRRFLRSGTLQIEEPGTAPATPHMPIPEAVAIRTKLVLIGSREQFYELQEHDPELARRFRVKVDFADSFPSGAASYRATSIFVAHTCRKFGLPQFTSAAVAGLLEAMHREADDQMRQSAVFADTETWVIESAEHCRARNARLVEATDVAAALRAREQRHSYPEQRMQQSVAEGDVLIALHGERVGQINALTQIDLGDYRYGAPVRVTARTFAGEDGLLNIEREAELSGPIHDKGVLILQHYLSALFAHNAPLALNASIAFEQEYHGVEGDSASCAELLVLLSSLSGLPLKQGIAVTGAINQHGELLPVGGINEKIEGYFRLCANAGLDGSQGVLIPQRNRRHLMLERQLVDAVARGLFHIHTAEQAADAMTLLSGCPFGAPDQAGSYPDNTVLGNAQSTLLAYRRACQLSGQHAPEPSKASHKRVR